jgi:L-alanine-DL-glutamate epimerase-like enolase superfamily enzyme
LKITDVRTTEIKGHGYSTYVRIYTDEGVIGNGECIHGGEGCPEMVHALKQEIIGESPRSAVDSEWPRHADRQAGNRVGGQ